MEKLCNHAKHEEGCKWCDESVIKKENNLISIILPSIRPQQLQECVKSIVDASEGVKIELIIIADFKCIYGPEIVENLNISWIFDPIRKGTIDPICQAESVATGEYLFVMSDEAKLYPGALLELRNFCQFYDNKVLTSPKHIPFFNFVYYGKWFAPFSFAHRSLIKKVGGLYDPIYKCFYADPDLSLRTYAHGFQVKECSSAEIYHPNNMADLGHKNNVASYVLDDRRTFKERWAHLGEFKDP